MIMKWLTRFEMLPKATKSSLRSQTRAEKEPRSHQEIMKTVKRQRLRQPQMNDKHGLLLVREHLRSSEAMDTN